MNIINRIFHNIERALFGYPAPRGRGAGRLLADGSFLDLDALTPAERLAYTRQSIVPERFGPVASAKQVDAYMRAREKVRIAALPNGSEFNQRAARHEAIHGRAWQASAYENPERWAHYLATGDCQHPEHEAESKAAAKRGETAKGQPDPRDLAGPSFPGFGTRY